MKKLISFLFLSFALISGAVSCTKDSIPLSPGEYFDKEGIKQYFDNVQFQDEVAYLGGLQQKDESWIRARSADKLISTPSSAKILILGGSSVRQNLKALSDAYNQGRFILIGNPDLEILRDIRDSLGWNFVIPIDKPMMDYGLCFCKYHSFLQTAPLRILTDPEEHEKAEGVIEVTGEKVYENTSFLMACRGLMDFIKRVKDEAENETKSSVAASSMDEKINTLTYEFVCNENWTTCMRGRYLMVFNSFVVGYSIYPCYVPEGVKNQGDYYAVKAVLTNYAPTMYEYQNPSDNGSPQVPVGKNPYPHYWAREYSFWGDCQFRGPYNTYATITSQAKDPADLVFSASGRPIPGTDIDTRTFSESSTFSWEVGISGGYSQGEGANIGFNAGIGGSTENRVSYSMNDMRVVNNSNGNSVKYDFIYQNLPEKDSDFDNYESQMPAICKSTADFDMSWEWMSQKYGDYDGTIIPLSTSVTQKLNIWARDKDAGIWHNYMNEYIRTNTQENRTLLSLARMPVGCLKIINKCQSNLIMYDITVNDSSTGKTVYEGTNNIAKDEFFEVLLPQKDRKYSVSLSLGKNSFDKVSYYSYDTEITLPLMLSSESDKRVLNMTESGGDFTSRAGYLQVVNQSTQNLVRNLTVYNAAGEVVYYHRSSLGFGHVADIFLNSNTEYYVTMEFGSASSWKPYRTEQNFKLPLYSKDTDILVLIASDNNGGDFVAQ